MSALMANQSVFSNPLGVKTIKGHTTVFVKKAGNVILAR